MTYLAQASSSVSTDPEALQQAAQDLAEQSGANEAVGAAQNFAADTASKLPEYLAWIKHVDMLFALGVLAFFAIAYYSFWKQRQASLLFGVILSSILFQFTPVLSWIPQIGEYPIYMVQSAAFALVAVLIAHFLYRSPFFEPMNLPTGSETFFFALVSAGLLIVLGVQWWPIDDSQTFSSAFQTVFLSDIAKSLWVLSPVVLAGVIRGKF